MRLRGSESGSGLPGPWPGSTWPSSPARCLGLLGPNGAGKSTTIRVLTTLLRPDEGTARVFGHDVVREGLAVRRRIALAGQAATVDDDLTGAEDLVLLGMLGGLRRLAARGRAESLLASFGLENSAATQVKRYSGGMRRRLDLAASLVTGADVYFLDEPTTGLDPASRAQVWDLVRALAADGATVLLTTQYLEEADKLAGPGRGHRPRACRRRGHSSGAEGGAREVEP